MSWSTTALMLVGPAEAGSFMGPSAGLRPIHQIGLHENSRPAWVCTVVDPDMAEEPRDKRVWIPSGTEHPVQDALVFVATCIVRDERVRSLLAELVKDVDAPHVELTRAEALADVREAVRPVLSQIHIGLMLFGGSLAFMDVDALEHYDVDVEVLTPAYQRVRREHGVDVEGSLAQIIR